MLPFPTHGYPAYPMYGLPPGVDPRMYLQQSIPGLQFPSSSAPPALQPPPPHQSTELISSGQAEPVEEWNVPTPYHFSPPTIGEYVPTNPKFQKNISSNNYPPKNAPDEWTQSWMKKYSDGHKPKLINRQEMIEKLSLIYNRIQALQANSASPSDHSSADYMREAADVDKEIASLDDPITVKLFLERQQKRNRKKKWIAKKKAYLKEKKSRAESEQHMHDRLISEWQQTVLAHEQQKKLAKEQAKARAIESARVAEQKKRAAESDSRLSKIELLRYLRRKKAGLPDDDPELAKFFAELVEKSKEQEKENEKEKPKEPIKAKEPPTIPSINPDPQQHSTQYWDSFYNAASSSLEKLIEVRSQWDQYLLTEDDTREGSSIPPYWVVPPAHTPQAWKKYLIWLTPEKKQKNM